MGDEINDTIGDVVSSRLVAETIRKSAEEVLLLALAEQGLVMTASDRARIAREIANNAAQHITLLQVTRS